VNVILGTKTIRSDWTGCQKSAIKRLKLKNNKILN